MSEEMKFCPGCGRHCDLSAPSCPRGEAYARGEMPAPHGGERTRRDRGEKERQHGEHGCHGEAHGEHGLHGHGPHREHRPLRQEEYDALDTDGKLGVKLRELHHTSRFVMESRGGQGKILSVLAHEGSMTQRALTEQLGIQPGSASEVIGKLERAGLIERSENAEDRRTANVRLTESGRKQAENAKQERPELFSALSAEEKEQLLTLFEKLSADWRTRFSDKSRHHGPTKDEP